MMPINSQTVIYPIEGKHKDRECDVSIIIPIYKSKRVIREQILRWLPENGITQEIIYIHNACPQNSITAIIEEWNKRVDKGLFSPKVIMSSTNTGFAGACNIGLYHSKGKIVIFLNADTTVTPNWIKPIVRAFDDPTVGIVGNLQLKEGDLQGTVDSAGSEWIWEEENFVHIGRHSYHGKAISSPFHYNELPSDLQHAQERDMVTGCCLAMPRQLCVEVGGFDERYQRGYWEDSELCMTVKEMGYKIMFTPDSKIFHKLAHSKSSNHPHQNANRKRFLTKWVDSGRIDPLIKASRPIPPLEISSILIKRLGAHGDVLVASAIASALKKKYPESLVHFQTRCPSVLSNNPFIDSVIEYGSEKPPMYQLLIDLDLAYERRPFTNILKCYADEAGVSVNDCQLFIDKKHVNKPGLENYVVVHAGRTAWEGRNWIEDRWQKLANQLHEMGLQIICVGGEGDSYVPCDADCRGKTTINELATLIADSKLFIGIDSMPFHIAQATKTKSVVFFGSIDPQTRILNSNVYPVFAKGLECLGCHHRQQPPSTTLTKCEIGNNLCESQVSTEQFLDQILKVLGDPC